MFNFDRCKRGRCGTDSTLYGRVMTDVNTDCDDDFTLIPEGEQHPDPILCEIQRKYDECRKQLTDRKFEYSALHSLNKTLTDNVNDLVSQKDRSGTVYLELIDMFQKHIDKTTSNLTIVKNSVVAIHGDGLDISTVRVPQGIDEIRHGVFRSCSLLTSINLPDSLTSIGVHSFSECVKLTRVILPPSLVNVDHYAFGYCLGLSSVSLPDSLTNVGAGAFSDCRSLTSIILPRNLTVIYDWTFQDCTTLTMVKLPSSLTSVGISAFAFCINLQLVVFPDTLTHIGCEAFQGCKGLISLILPDSLTSVEYAAFDACESMTYVSLPHKLNHVGRYSFGCRNLESISFRPPASRGAFIVWCLTKDHNNRDNLDVINVTHITGVLRLITMFALECRDISSFAPIAMRERSTLTLRDWCGVGWFNRDELSETPSTIVPKFKYPGDRPSRIVSHNQLLDVDFSVDSEW